MQITFTRTNYEHIAELEQADPAHYALEQGLINRHDEPIRKVIGAWRWEGLHEYRAVILESILRGRTMDFGGSAGPVGYGAEIVDREAPARAPYDVAGQFECIFSSHTLEHIPDLGLCLSCLTAKLVPGGRLVVYVPSYRAAHLRAENFPDHCQTFYLMSDGLQDPPAYWVCLDRLLSTHYEILVAANTDANNLLIIAQKKT